MRDPYDAESRARKAAEELVGAAVTAVLPAYAGANSRIFKVEAAHGPFALKNYPVRPGDTRSRAEVEWKALHFLSRHCNGAAPRPVARDAAGQFLLMEWIEGEPLKRHTPQDVLLATDFIGRIFASSADPEAAAFPLASEACLSAAIIVRQIEQRLTALASEPALTVFLRETILPALAAAKGAIPSADGELEQELRRLIPSDFGFHNALRQPDGRVRYIDFDYFGWDDPVKVAADFLLHPAMQLSTQEKIDFVAGLVRWLPADRGFLPRLAARLPLYALRWAMILFNPFRRDRAQDLPADANKRDALREERIAKARNLIASRDDAMIATLQSQ